MTGAVLGIDYGDRHIGLALAASPLAEPLATINKADFPGQIGKILEKYQIQTLVVGDCPPDFFAVLKNLNLPVYRVDETLSTVDAAISLFHTTQTRRRSLIHAASAAVILQSWLDSRPPNR